MMLSRFLVRVSSLTVLPQPDDMMGLSWTEYEEKAWVPKIARESLASLCHLVTRPPHLVLYHMLKCEGLGRCTSFKSSMDFFWIWLDSGSGRCI